MRHTPPNQARHTNPALHIPFEVVRNFESFFCAPPASAGRVGALIRWAN